MTLHLPVCAIGSAGLRPADQRAARGFERARKPIRLHRTRRARNATPANAIYVGRPTLFANPFARRPRIGHKRSVILFASWLHDGLSARILTAAGFSEAEIAALARRRVKLLASLRRLRGRDLQCWCPLTSAWCHADVLLDAAA